MISLADRKVVYELEQILKEESKREAKSNYYEYVKYVHRGKYGYTRHGKYVCDILQQAIENKKKMRNGEMPTENQFFIISMPPRHGKSMTITETFPSYYLGHLPDDRVIEGSYNETFAQKFGKKNKEKVKDFGKDLFDIEIKKDTSSATDWGIDKTSGGMISRGILSGITGEGADLMIIDDPIKNREEANSETRRQKLWDEWIDTLSTRLHPGAIVIVIMTRWHEDDLVGRLLNSEYGEVLPWKVINLPLECDETHINVEGNPLHRELGEPLWPERYGKKYMEQRKKYPTSFNSLFQGRPTAQEGNVLKRKWWQYYDVLPKMIMKLISIDASFKDNKDNDYVSIQVWGKRDADMYLIDRTNARMDFPTTLKAIRNIVNKHPDAHLKLVEDKANGPAIIAMLKHEIGGIVAVNPEGGKVARVNAVSPYIEAGNVYIPRQASWIHDFVEECAAFPNGDHDDDVDSMSQALNRFIYYYAETEKKKPKPKPYDPLADDEGYNDGFIGM